MERRAAEIDSHREEAYSGDTQMVPHSVSVTSKHSLAWIILLVVNSLYYFLTLKWYIKAGTNSISPWDVHVIAPTAPQNLYMKRLHLKVTVVIF